MVPRGEGPKPTSGIACRGPRLSRTAESGSHTVVNVGKAPRCGLPTDGVSPAQVGWPPLDQPGSNQPVIDPPGPPRYRRRT